MNRRDFLKRAASAAALFSDERRYAVAEPAVAEPFWGYLVHLSFNMWGDRPAPDKDEYWTAQPYLRFDDSLWRDLIPKMQETGVTLALLDLGDGVRYESHPEIAVENAWPMARLKEELARLREAGLEPIPKLNFSATHDVWLKAYARQLSTAAYYGVCGDLIDEVNALFGSPRFFHLGMDEETAEFQEDYEYAVMRQRDLWWHDVEFLIKKVEAGGSRAWIWSDYSWRHPETFFARMPKSVLQSSYFYEEEINPANEAVKGYVALDERQYEQAPTGSTRIGPENFEKTVLWCTGRLSGARIRGFLQTSWKPMLEACRQRHFDALEQVGRARVKYAAKVHSPVHA